MDFKGGLAGLFAQASRMKDEMQRIQGEMANRTVEATVGGGMVKVMANGKNEIVSLVIDPEALKLNDKEMLQDLIKAGVNQALRQSQDLMAQEMRKLTGGLGLGSLASLFEK